eukprot:4422909-Pyramimonas_sp.AAC.1
MQFCSDAVGALAELLQAQAQVIQVRKFRIIAIHSIGTHAHAAQRLATSANAHTWARRGNAPAQGRQCCE